MPVKSKSRIKPVIEEVVEEKPAETSPEMPETSEKLTPEPASESTLEPVEAVVEEPTAPEEASTELSKQPEPPSAQHSKMNMKLIIVITLVSALVAAFVSGGVYVYLSGLENVGDDGSEVVLEPTSAPSATPEATEAPEEVVDISEYSVQVLNGSGAIGAASGGENVLTEAGFTVEETGNAGRYDYETTVVQVKSSVSASVVSMLQKALEDNDYEVEIGEELEEGSEYDIVVIVGAS